MRDVGIGWVIQPGPSRVPGAKATLALSVSALSLSDLVAPTIGEPALAASAPLDSALDPDVPAVGAGDVVEPSPTEDAGAVVSLPAGDVDGIWDRFEMPRVDASAMLARSAPRAP